MTCRTLKLLLETEEMTMETKPFYQSKAVWGGVIALLSVVAGAFGYSVGADDQIALVDALATGGGAVGALLAVYGRIVASGKITK
jgi:hypothetical protein